MCFSNITITHFVYQMDLFKYFKNLFDSIPSYRKLVLLMFLFKDDVDFLQECGFVKRILIVLVKSLKVFYSIKMKNIWI